MKCHKFAHCPAFPPSHALSGTEGETASSSQWNSVRLTTLRFSAGSKDQCLSGKCEGAKQGQGALLSRALPRPHCSPCRGLFNAQALGLGRVRCRARARCSMKKWDTLLVARAALQQSHVGRGGSGCKSDNCCHQYLFLGRTMRQRLPLYAGSRRWTHSSWAGHEQRHCDSVKVCVIYWHLS
jgi:hypothetical protein